LCCLFFFDLRLLITPFGIFKLFAIVLSVLRFTASDYPLWYLQAPHNTNQCPFVYFDNTGKIQHCNVYGFF
jgi:hypothetical protein